jgi:Dna[CI] antecedent DciA-like protein
MAKRSAENSSLGDVLKNFISSSHKLEKGLNKVSAQQAWHNVMGSAISKYTTQVLLERNTLYVRLSSSVLREELSYGKEKIIKLLNEELRKELVTKLVLR